MILTALDKGKARALPEAVGAEQTAEAAQATSSSSDSDSDSDSDSSSESSSGDSDSEEEITPEILESLLEKARERARAFSLKGPRAATEDEEEVIQLEKEADEEPLPPLDPGLLPTPYIQLSDSKDTKASITRDLDAEQVEKASSSAIPTNPAPPPSALPKEKPLTKKEKKAARNKTAGPSWFDLPAPSEAELPKLYREVEALRLRNQLDPKRFYRKDPGEGKGIKGLPKYFAIGTIIADPTPFGTASADNLSRSQRKRTLVDELVDDAEAKSYAKKKFKDLQSVRGAKGRGTLAQRQAKRKPKW